MRARPQCSQTLRSQKIQETSRKHEREWNDVSQFYSGGSAVCSDLFWQLSCLQGGSAYTELPSSCFLCPGRLYLPFQGERESGGHEGTVCPGLGRRAGNRLPAAQPSPDRLERLDLAYLFPGLHWLLRRIYAEAVHAGACSAGKRRGEGRKAVTLCLRAGCCLLGLLSDRVPGCGLHPSLFG